MQKKASVSDLQPDQPTTLTVGRLELRLGFLDGFILQISERRLPVFRAEVDARPDRVGQLLTGKQTDTAYITGAITTTGRRGL